MYPKLSYLNVLTFITQYMTSPEPWDLYSDITLHDKENKILVHIITDSDWDIQVNLTDDSDEQNELDWGWCCVMQWEEEEDDDGNDIETEDIRIQKILKTGTPEQVNELITEKALWIWELIHTS